MGFPFRAFKPLLRWLARVPTLLYRLHCGWLLAERFLLLRHTGRKTGRCRSTVLEVVAKDDVIKCYYVVAGLGPKSDWYRNVMLAPHVDIEVGRRRLHAIAERVPLDEAAAVFGTYARQHRFIARYVELGLGLRGRDDDLSELARRYPLVRLRTAETIARPVVRIAGKRVKGNVALAYKGVPQPVRR